MRGPRTNLESTMRLTVTCAAIAAASLFSSMSAIAAGMGAPRAMTAPTAHATAAPTRTTSTTMRGPAQTGQPNQSCGSATAPNTPGNAAMAPGSAFNPDGHAGTVYAGQQPQNSRNTASVSQYDAACAHQR
jgi:hypothetical protein